MAIVRHKFIDHQIHQETRILIIGTFNPDAADNPADFFYGRSRNHLWRLLPVAFGQQDLRRASRQLKLHFISSQHIDFIDLISEIDTEQGQDANYDDHYIDGRVLVWRDVVSEIDRLNNLQKVCVTRKTFSDVPNIRERVNAIKRHCAGRNVLFTEIVTPARFYNDEKQAEWTRFLSGRER